MIWYVFPIKDGMSWEGHLSGLITGFIFALIFRKQVAKPERYRWETPDYNEEDDPFMRHFDENGNFIEHITQIDNDSDEESGGPEKTNVNYIFKENKD
jgi:hypothetical protein